MTRTIRLSLARDVSIVISNAQALERKILTRQADDARADVIDEAAMMAWRRLEQAIERLNQARSALEAP